MTAISDFSAPVFAFLCVQRGASWAQTSRIRIGLRIGLPCIVFVFWWRVLASQLLLLTRVVIREVQKTLFSCKPEMF